jgi:hypothetical protein
VLGSFPAVQPSLAYHLLLGAGNNHGCGKRNLGPLCGQIAAPLALLPDNKSTRCGFGNATARFGCSGIAGMDLMTVDDRGEDRGLTPAEQTKTINCVEPWAAVGAGACK